MRRPATTRPPAHGSAAVRPDFWSLTKDAWSRAWRSEEPRCRVCGYDLRGLLAPDDVFRCPECGEATRRHEAVAPAKDRQSWWARLQVPVLLVLAGCLLWVVSGWVPVLILPAVALLLALVALSFRALRPTTNFSRSLPLLAHRLGHRHARTSLDRALSGTLRPSDPPARSRDEPARP